MGIVLIPLSLSSPAAAQNGSYQTPGGLTVYPSRVYTNYPAPGSVAQTASRRSYLATVYNTDPSTGVTTTSPGFDFQAFCDDIGNRFQTMISSVMPLFLKILIPLLGVIFLLTVIRMLTR